MIVRELRRSVAVEQFGKDATSFIILSSGGVRMAEIRLASPQMGIMSGRSGSRADSAGCDSADGSVKIAAFDVAGREAVNGG